MRYVAFCRCCQITFICIRFMIKRGQARKKFGLKNFKTRYIYICMKEVVVIQLC